MRVESKLNIRNSERISELENSQSEIGKGELLEQFSSLMDKIAAQVSSPAGAGLPETADYIEPASQPEASEEQSPEVVALPAAEQRAEEPVDQEVAEQEQQQDVTAEELPSEEEEIVEEELSSKELETETDSEPKIEAEKKEAKEPEVQGQSQAASEQVIEKAASETLAEPEQQKQASKAAGEQGHNAKAQQAPEQAQLQESTKQQVSEQPVPEQPKAELKNQATANPQAQFNEQGESSDFGAGFKSLVEELVTAAQPKAAASTSNESGSRVAKLVTAVLTQLRSEFGTNSATSQSGNSTNATSNVQLAAQDLRAGESKGKAKAKSAVPLKQHEALRTLKRVEEALQTAAKSRDGKSISFRLDPPSLGKVRVDVTLRDGVLHARLGAESSSVQNLLRDKAFELQRMLRDLGLNVDQVSVSVGSEQHQSEQRFGAGNSGNDASGRQNFDQSLANSSGDVPAGIVGAETAPQTPLDHWVA